ncbi:unnamed protein product, partial [Oppiella nova]
VENVWAHGRLIDPPSRSSAWRFGYKTKINYNDNELFCGGFTRQWKRNGGKCGICGDPYDGKRDNETPNGKYAKTLAITRTYISGQTIAAKVQLTANHNGFFVFKVCPAVNDSQEVTQQCLDRFALNVLDPQNSSDKYTVPSPKAETFTIDLKLPDGLACDRCVFQWTYTSANNWGKCDNGLSAVGCGPQETFRGCADVRILAHNNTLNETEMTTTPHYVVPDSDPNDETLNTIESKRVLTTTDSSYTPIKYNDNSKRVLTAAHPFYTPVEYNDIKRESGCKSTGIWRAVPNMDDWCRTNCALNYCPQSHCTCNHN